jgi:transposase
MDMEKLCGGIDTHKENFVGYIMDEEGRLVREHLFPATKEAVEKFTTGIPNSEMTIAIGACGIWQGAYTIFRELGYEVTLASPNSKQREEQ